MLTARSASVTGARRLLQRKYRDREGHFLVEGPQAVREAVVAGLVERMYATPEAVGRYPEIVDRLRAAGRAHFLCEPGAVQALAETQNPQGLVAVARTVDVSLTTAVAGFEASVLRLTVLLADIRDPGNAGTVIRTADAAGADLVALSPGSVDVHNGKCVRASAGSIFHLPIVAGTPLAEVVAALRERGVRVLAADGGGSVDLFSLSGAGELAGPTAWLFGNEAWGLPAETAALADDLVRIPIWGRAESLNLAAAAAVCLYASAQAQSTYQS